MPRTQLDLSTRLAVEGEPAPGHLTLHRKAVVTAASTNLTHDSAPRPNFSWTVGVFVLMVGFFALFSIASLMYRTTSSPGDWISFLSLNPVTALCFAGASVSLWLRRRQPARGKLLGLSYFVSLVILGVAITRLADIQMGSTFCPDNLPIWATLSNGQAYPEHIPPNAAIYFLFISVALLVLDLNAWPAFLHPQVLITPVLCISVAELLGYVFGAHGFQQFPRYAPMSLQSLIAFLLISVALMLCRPDQGYFKLIPSASPGSRSFARLFPVSIFIPVAMASLTVYGINNGWFASVGTAAAILATTAIIELSVCVLLNSLALNRTDQERQQAEIEQRRLLLELETSNRVLQLEITERKRMEEKATHEATHDTLTGLPNRLLFLDRLRHSISWTTRHKKMFALLYIDIDNFKPVNDQYGHQVGDMLLKALAIRLRSTMREVDTVARLGGDEFAAIMDAPVNGQHALLLARRMSEAVCQAYPLDVPGHEKPIDVYIGMSIGVSLFPIHANNLDGLVREADRAMFKAKLDGKTRGKISANIRLAVTRAETAF